MQGSEKEADRSRTPLSIDLPLLKDHRKLFHLMMLLMAKQVTFPLRIGDEYLYLIYKQGCPLFQSIITLFAFHLLFASRLYIFCMLQQRYEGTYNIKDKIQGK